jgi:hypothetical protein
LLAKLLTLEFGQAAQAFQVRLAAATLADLERWAERILQANTIEDVFAE